MGDLIVVPSKDQFDLQTRLHRQVRNSLYEVVGMFDIHHDTILSQLDSAQTSQIENYRQWWQTLRSFLLQQATLHDEFAQHLEMARQSYHIHEQQVVSSLQTDPPVSQQ
jgi:hypothetical protein